MKKYVYLTLLSTLLIGCGYHNPQREIVRVWKVSQIEVSTAEENAPTRSWKRVEFVDNILYEFKKEGSYLISKNKQKDYGNWQLSSDNKVLILSSALNSADNIEFVVEQFTNFNLVLSNHEKGNVEKITLIPKP